MKNNHYILIVAGGTGTRLYPRSREAKPKQFQKIFGNKTLLEQTYLRSKKIVGKNNIFISTNEKYVNITKKFLPEINSKQIISEPCKKNTAPAISLAVAKIYQSDPSAIIASIHSDHIVLKEDAFKDVINLAFDSIEIEKDIIFTIGIKPTHAHTGYGYIEKGKLKKEIDNFKIFWAEKFVEKPNHQTAEKYFKTGRFDWNAGYFIFDAKHYLDELKKYALKLSKGINKIVKDKNNLKTIYEKFESEPVDTVIMERTDKIAVIPVDLGWSDVGSWDSVSQLFENDTDDGDGNYFEGLVSLVDTKNSMVLNESGNKLIATIGLEDIIVVSSEDAILIVKKGKSEEVKQIVEELKEKRKHHLV
ncbi:MAG: Mannose-1-phosphate guanylyltransferase [Berkelbacteria bacterium GW2011_GWA2_35_9]|uniref:Mannose-1-phosphate guanylyltransferase n=1 Tax=Berkelbacteria bacterium GW2011_GWA2_35_9 TaxID=1618333 RepID=A0A0G0GBW9_9BACT|nr:MAG: Mannose-1-phosphate guanylyltransferase [Berkelbacteria bacterium GW2011_GWA2_35_9]